ncbi:MAG: Si-specific NAD(P)(+) transhydrogenase [Planctomycetes bacterium]|nr:Si-specific NAD(P)(+) transhydrogenase [Planctomycetota bacterium]
METFDVVVIGSGPAGHKATIQAAKAGKRVLLVERETNVGGACVHRGTIPSKTLRETALAFTAFRRKTGEVFPITVREDLEVASLMTRMEEVVKAHERFMTEQLRRNGATKLHGRARFLDDRTIAVEQVRGNVRRARGEVIIIATGSQPRAPADVPIDHDKILDSDSILSMTWLPRSLTVLGAGVIASEYASIFAALGVKVTMIDKGMRPLAFLDSEIADKFVAAFKRNGGCYLGGRRHVKVEWDGIDSVVTTLDDGTEIRSERLLCCLGRISNVDDLDLAAAGLAVNERGLLAVDAHCATKVPHIYAVGDVIGPPALASSSMEQGRRAVCHALGLSLGHGSETIPAGIYTIPEMSQVGLTEIEAIKKYGGCLVGRARYEELARGQISAIQDGMLKLVADPGGQRVLGVQIVGEGACELIHVGQMALIGGSDVDSFVDNIFNFPTLAEAYRVAALDIVKQRAKLFPNGLPAVMPTLDAPLKTA